MIAVLRPRRAVRAAFAALICAGMLAGAALSVGAAEVSALDSDYDGLSDEMEVSLHGTDPFNADTDFDGLIDGVEWTYPSNPLYPDTDGDGFGDGYEYQFGTDLLNPDSFPLVPGRG